MRKFFAILLVLMPFVAEAQCVFRYKHLEVICTSPNGDVIMENGSPTIKDSIAIVSALLRERYFDGFVITNVSKSPITVRWRKCGASSERKDYHATVMADISTLNPQSGEQTLYVGEKAVFLMAHLPWCDEMFSKYPKNQKASLHIPIIIGDRAIEYSFNFVANRVKQE